MTLEHETSGLRQTGNDHHRILTQLGFHVGIKMDNNRHKLSWLDPSVSFHYLHDRLIEELEELVEAVRRDGDVWGEAADVAYLAAMIADRHTRQPAKDPT